MTINTNSVTEGSSPSYIKLTIGDFCYSPHISLFTLVTHTGFEPMLTA